MAWEEWEQIKTGTATRHGAGTRLNQLAPAGGSGGGAPDLVSSPAQKQAAAKAIEERLDPKNR
ncbi:hypothetical protein [Streptomyces sp. NPDC023838]|uniref:hypothetical protein n=1 Tax=Streptomyces sp. NPDC023838 TaxID=3154325 RepID=UPI0033C711CE